MDIQKIGASLISQTAEANLGLATLNLDFSIIKVEAPTEFQPLRNELSPTRRNAAEDGMPHVTARKIGVLFQGWVPRTPHLIKAYGRRSVEVAQCRAVNPKATKADRVFAEHMGIDGTGIWAAATSGAHAISVYLLACMLARMWTAPEATAIWAELVEERKKELAAVESVDPTYEQSQLASRISIPREDLAQWDASARSWLQAADEAMTKRQKQLMLILNNVELPVSTNPHLLTNVRQSWVSAMTTIDSLIQGVAQSIEDGAVLVGLSSWHIYPDILVLGKMPSQIQVEQNDTLVNPGGILTIGLHIESPQHHSVYWSLSLAHLRYYGGPVVAERSLDTQGNRVTIYELSQVAVGSLTRRWMMGKGQISALLTQLYDYIAPISQSHTDGPVRYWLHYMSRAVEPLLGSDILAKKNCLQLMRYGERRCPNFFGQQLHIPPLFGVLNLNTILQLLTSYEAGVEIIRSYAQGIKSKRDRGFVIRYAVGSGDAQMYSIDFEYATVIPTPGLSLKRALDGNKVQPSEHCRWIETFKGRMPYGGSRLTRFEGEDAFRVDDESIQLSRNAMRWNYPPAAFSAYKETEQNGPMSSYIAGFDDGDHNILQDVDHVKFQLVAGDPFRIALFATKTPDEDNWISDFPPWAPETIGPEILTMALQRGSLDSAKLLEYMSQFVDHESRQDFLSSLRALATVDNIYKMLPGSLAALGVTSHPLCDMPWVPKTRTARSNLLKFRFSAFPEDVGMTFACIALFESGSLAMDHSSLKSVMAMATRDSIYITAALLCDPSEQCFPHEVRRIRGSIGKPGIAMLIPPKQVRVRDTEPDWRQVNHNVFDGRLEDSFQSTSLHLWFTEYVLPIDVGMHGCHGFEAYFLESVVSLHDRGHWIADLNILANRGSPLLRRLSKDRCLHSRLENRAVTGNPRFTVIDNWDEIFDPAGNTAIVRSTGNWLGRLAATSLCLQLGRPTVVLPNQFCWDCVMSMWGEMRCATRAEQGQEDDEAAGLSEAHEEATWNGKAGKWTFKIRVSTSNHSSAGETSLQDGDISRREADAILETMSDLVIIC